MQNNKGKASSGVWGWVLVVITTVLIYFLDKPMGSIPALGRLLDPVNGSMANAELVNKDFSATHDFAGLKGVSVWFDERMVPHIHAADEHDVYFLEGYIHAYFRLWQMDLQTRAAAGRVSEVVGEKAFEFDRKQRRKGMVYGAERSLKAMEADPRTKLVMDAYTEGVNAFIASLQYREYPLEYKLMGFKPEKWTNLKIALLLKYMADDLTGRVDDLGLTYLRDVLPREQFNLLFPERIEGANPAIPTGTLFDKPSLSIPNTPSDSVAFPHFKPADFGGPREEGKGSNNWVVSGVKTASGAAILCNDPHLGLNLPALWFEAQLQAPGMNVYGASLPGTPGVVLGFNDSVSWGFTNNYRDVKDYYVINPVAENGNKYWFSGQQVDFIKRVERIQVKGKPDFLDTVAYTIHGPVMYDDNYGERNGLRKMLAVCWMGHRATNELLAIYLLNKSGNYGEFVDAIMNFQCPSQNIAYADRKGNIALWGQGQYANLWKGQGRFVMNGSDSATLWKELIPMRENPHVLNPAQGFVSSANQITTDTTYPYYYNSGGFVNLRAWRMNEMLSKMQQITIDDMCKMQNDNHSLLAERMLPALLRYCSAIHDPYIDRLRKWDYDLSAESEAASLFQVWWYYFFGSIWHPVLGGRVPGNLMPLQERTMQLFLADIHPVKGVPVDGYYSSIVTQSYKQAVDSINRFPRDRSGQAKWYQVKNTSVNHLAKLPAFSYTHIKTGGWGNAINAMKGDHGPSWRLVVQMGKEIEAYGLYPGGQSGNPGSKYYANFIDHWAEGKYYKLLFLPNSDQQNNERIRYVWKVN